MDLHVEVPFSIAAHAAAPSRVSALVLPPPPPAPPPLGTAANAVAAAAASAVATASRQALPVGEVCLLTAAVRVTAPCEVRVTSMYCCCTQACAQNSRCCHHHQVLVSTSLHKGGRAHGCGDARA